MNSVQASLELFGMGQRASCSGCEERPHHGAGHQPRVQHLCPRGGAAQGQGGEPQAHGGPIIRDGGAVQKEEKWVLY